MNGEFKIFYGGFKKIRAVLGRGIGAQMVHKLLLAFIFDVLIVVRQQPDQPLQFPALAGLGGQLILQGDNGFWGAFRHRSVTSPHHVNG